MCACVQGFSGLEKFTFLMNIPKPMTKNNYNKLIKTLNVLKLLQRNND